MKHLRRVLADIPCAAAMRERLLDDRPFTEAELAAAAHVLAQRPGEPQAELPLGDCAA